MSAPAGHPATIPENAYGHRKRLDWLVSQIGRPRLVAEVGCGTGLMIALPLARLGYPVVGLDTDAPSIALGRSLFERAGLDPSRLTTRTLAALPSRPDTIIASEVLEHVPDAELPRLFVALREALTPSGRLLVTVPNGYGWFELESALWWRAGLGRLVERLGVDRAVRQLKRVLAGWEPGDETPSTLAHSPHVQRFTYRSIRRRLAEAGFEVTGTTGSVLFAGPFSNLLFTGIGPLMRLNAWLGSLCAPLASGFYVACRVAEARGAGTLVVAKDARHEPAAPAGATALTFADLAASVKRARILPWLGRYRDARLVTHRLDVMSRPLVTTLLLRWVSRGACRLTDERGAGVAVGPREIAHALWRYGRDVARRPRLLSRVRREVARLTREASAPHAPRVDPGGRPVYLRTDHAFGLASGGSVGHIAGVLNHLDRYAGPPVFLTSDRIPTVRPDVETHEIPPGDAFRDFLELPLIAYTATFAREAEARLGGRRPAFVYQRYGLDNYAGVLLARRYGVPFVLEFNGSEVWVNRHWGGRPDRYERLATAIERLNLLAADLVVVVSRVLADDLAAQGIPRERILVNPNGVDPVRYAPDVDGGPVRRRHGLEGRVVVGFIGTFGPWHGAEVLAEAFGRLLATRPSARRDLRLLLVGDGARLGAVREAVARLGLEEVCVLTGLVPQADGPAHLAACDVLVAPHVPNPDGSRFFGSPTKLFEYMAMGKGIVASRLEQIGEVLAHDETAWLVPPGDVDALARGIATLVDDAPRRDRLGRAARAAAVARHSWAEHTRRIVEALAERCR